MATQSQSCRQCFVRIFSLQSVYTSVPSVIAMRTTAWVMPTRFSSPTAFFSPWNMDFPATPPAAAPTARAVAMRISILAVPARRFFQTDTTDMASTVHPERKLMLLTPMTPVASSTGLMITPPPIPQTDPAVQDRMLTAKNMKTIPIVLLPSVLSVISSKSGVCRALFLHYTLFFSFSSTQNLFLLSSARLLFPRECIIVEIISHKQCMQEIKERL